MNLDFTQANGGELIILAVVGLLILFAGYRIKKIAFFIMWFFVGYSLMGLMMPELNRLVPEIASNNVWQVLLPIAGGLLAAMLGFMVEKLCVAGIAFALTLIITAQYFGNDMTTLAIGGVVGVIMASLAVVMMKPATIIITAVAGSYIITDCILFWIPTIDAVVYYFPILIGVTAIGSVVQFTTTKHLN